MIGVRRASWEAARWAHCLQIASDFEFSVIINSKDPGCACQVIAYLKSAIIAAMKVARGSPQRG